MYFVLSTLLFSRLIMRPLKNAAWFRSFHKQPCFLEHDAGSFACATANIPMKELRA